MGSSSSKQETQLTLIDRQVNSLRSSMRSTNRRLSKTDQEQYMKALVDYANQADSLKGKVRSKRLKNIQRNISLAVEDVCTTNQQEGDLDMGAVETSSFVQVPLSKRQMSNSDLSARPAKKQKSSQESSSKAYTATLQEIEQKWKSLKPQINVALEQRSLTDLRVYQETIKVLVTSLEMIDVKEHTPLGDKKRKLDGSIISNYHKITDAMKEIRREKNINYLTKQNRKALKELDDIQKELTQIHSTIESLVNDKNYKVLNELKDKIAELRHRLTSVSTVDENTIEVQKTLLDKLMNISKVLEHSTKSDSQSDLTKAQANYEDIVRNIASGNSIDKDEIKIKLESLQSFINGIMEDDDTIVRKKQQLLNNVRQSFSFILDQELNIQNVADQALDEEIITKVDTTEEKDVEKKGQNDNPESVYKKTDLKVLNDLCTNWKSLENILQTSSLEDYSIIEKTLDDIQKSMEETRSKIKESKSLPLCLNNKKLNHSTPNLNNIKQPNKKFGSSLSVDATDPPLIKTKAKVYHLSTPHIQTIDDQPIVLRNKQFYRNNINPEDGRPFSKIEDIKRQVNYIKEKIEESPQKQHLKNKLESYVEIISSFVHHQNQGIASSAKALLAEIQELLKGLSNISEALNLTSKRRASVEMSLENLVAIQVAVEELEKAVGSFKGFKDDQEYRTIVGRLLECQKFLKNIEIPSKYDTINQQKDDILNRIETAYNVLESKCFNYPEDNEVMSTKKKLDNLKERVRRFSGPYKGISYNQIEKELNKVLVNIETINNKIISDDITKDVEKHLKILEHKATKDQSFRRTLMESKSKNEDEEKLMKLKSDLQDIKTEINTAPPSDVNLHIGLKSRLDLVKLGLDQLRFTIEEDEKQRDILYNEVESLKTVVETKISLAKQAIKQISIEQDKEKKDLEELQKIQEKFESFKHEIESFTGTTFHHKFYELDEYSIRLILKMDKLEFKKGSEAHNRKLNLLREIYNHGDLLDARAKESENLLEIERAVDDVEKNFPRSVKLNDLDTLIEKVTTLKKQLEQGQFNKHLSQRKETCSKRMGDLLQKALELKNTSRTKDVTVSNTETYFDNFISNSQLQFNKIKEEVENFNGVKSDKKFQELNSHLTTLFLSLNNFQLPQNTKLYFRRQELFKEMHMTTDMLKNKAYENEAVKDIYKHMNYINKLIDDYKGKDEQLNEMENELRTVQSKLERTKIKEDNRRSLDQKLDILMEEYTRLSKAKEANQLETTTRRSQNDLLKDFTNINISGPSISLISDIQHQINLVRQTVVAFVNTDTSEEYKLIEDTLLTLKVRLNKLDTEKDQKLAKKRVDLETEIQECFDILDDRSAEAATLMAIEEALNQVNKKFTDGITKEEKSLIDEKLISLQLRLGKLSVNDDLVKRKNICVDRLVNYMKLLKKQND